MNSIIEICRRNTRKVFEDFSKKPTNELCIEGKIFFIMN